MDERARLAFDNLSNEPHTLKLFTADGQIVRCWENILGNQIDIFRGNLPSGLYGLELAKEQELISYGKVILR